MQSRLRTTLWPLAVVVATILAFPSPAAAQVDLDVRGGVYTDLEDAFVGGGVLMQLTREWYFNPNVEWVFVSPGDLWTLNADFHFDFATRGPLSIWAGVGPALVFQDFDDAGIRGRRSDDETDFGVNLLAGLGMATGEVRPYLQGKVLISDETEAVVALGLRF